VTGEIQQKSEMILNEGIDGKSENNQKISLILVIECNTLQKSEINEEKNQPILLILGI
jgi:hypothetical protein